MREQGRVEHKESELPKFVELFFRALEKVERKHGR